VTHLRDRGVYMQDRFAFTAKYWGDRAVVCRSVEDCPGPIVEQEFGEFETWTQANTFAARLNEGLEISPIEAEQLIASSILRTGELLREAGLPNLVGQQARFLMTRRPLRVQFVLAELDLAVTFCRIVRSKPSPHTSRLLRNARNALFNAMHYVVHSELAACDLEAITERLKRLQAVFEESAPGRADTGLTSGVDQEIKASK
jgi:hypothetical protein